MRPLALAVAVVVAAGLSGCSEPTSTVRGTVTHAGKPLGGVTVTFFAADNRTITADTAADGTYSAAVPGRGTVRASVQAPPPTPKSRPDPPAARAGRDGDALKAAADDDRGKLARMPPASELPAGVTLPAGYDNPATSKLTFELTGGPQVFDIDLK